MVLALLVLCVLLCKCVHLYGQDLLVDNLQFRHILRGNYSFFLIISNLLYYPLIMQSNILCCLCCIKYITSMSYYITIYINCICIPNAIIFKTGSSTTNLVLSNVPGSVCVSVHFRLLPPYNTKSFFMILDVFCVRGSIYSCKFYTIGILPKAICESSPRTSSNVLPAVCSLIKINNTIIFYYTTASVICSCFPSTEIPYCISKYCPIVDVIFKIQYVLLYKYIKHRQIVQYHLHHILFR